MTYTKIVQLVWMGNKMFKMTSSSYLRLIVAALIIALGLNVSDQVLAASFDVNENGGVEVVEGGVTDSYIVQVEVGDPPAAEAIYTANSDEQCTVTTPDGGNTQTIAAGSTAPFNVTVTAVDDAIAENPFHTCIITHSITSVGDPAYNGLGFTPTTVNVQDNDIAALVVPSAPITVAEGGAPVSYQVNTSTPATATVVIEFTTNGQCTIVSANPQSIPVNSTAPVSITVTANDDLVDEPSPHPCLISHSLAESLDPIYAGLSSIDYTVNVTDDDVSGITVSPDPVTVTEPNGTDTYEISLNSEPSDPVTIDFVATGDCIITSSNPLELDETTLNATISIEAVDDNIVNGTRTCTISHTVNSLDGNYDGVTVANKLVSVEDDDVPGFFFDPLGIGVNEQGATTNYYDIGLTTLPLGGVTITAAIIDSPPQQCSIVSVTGAPILDNLTDRIRVTVQAIDDAANEVSPHLCNIGHTVTSADPAYDGLPIDDYSVFVTDNETPSFNLSTPSGDLIEAGTPNRTYTITLSQPTTQSINFTLTPNDECEIVGPVASIPISGTGPVTVTVRAIDDNIVDAAPHTCIIEHAVTTSGNYNGVTILDQTISVIDNDTTSIAISDETVTEGDAGFVPMIFDATLTNPSEVPVTVNYTTVNGSAIAPADFTAVTNTVTFAPLEIAQTIDVDIIGDLAVEGDENFTVTLNSPTGAAIGDGTGIGTITDNDDPTVPPNASIADVIQAEGGSGNTPFVFTITLDAPAVGGETITYSTANGTADTPGDYAAVVTATSPAFAAGQLTQTVTVNVVGDTTPETNDTFFVNLTGATGLVISDNQALGTISNDDVEVSINDVTVTEGNTGSTTPVTFTVTVTGALTSALTVNFTVVENSATEPEDFVTLTASLIPFGISGTPSQTQTIAFNIVGDAEVEGNHQFFVDITAPGATVTDNRGVGTINDDDIGVGPNASINDVTQVEGAVATFDFVISLDAPAVGGETITYTTANNTATAGSDYTAVTATYTFVAAETTHTVSVPVAADTTPEVNETFTVTLSAPTGLNITDSLGTGTITNDDIEVSISDPFVIEGNSGPAALNFIVTVTGALNAALDVNFVTTDGTATAPGDYVAVTTSPLNFPVNAGISQNQTIVVNAIGDVIDESDETVFVDLSATGVTLVAGGRGTGTIQDDDVTGVPEVAIADATANEGAVMTFTVTVNGTLTAPLSINFVDAEDSATNPEDYVFVTASPLIFPVDALTTRFQTVTVNTVQDTIVEPSQLFSVTITAAGATITDAEATGTIVDDDTASVPNVTIADVTQAEGIGSFTFTIALSSPAVGGETITFVTSDGTVPGSIANAPADYTAIPATAYTFIVGETSHTITVTIIDDVIDEPDEQFLVTLSAPTGLNITDNQATGTITDNDIAPVLPVVTINSPDAVAEGNTGTKIITFTISLSAPATGAEQITYATANGTATAGSDYVTIVATTHTFAAGSTSVDVSVTINGDLNVEGNETFFVNLTNPVGVTVNGGQGTGTINNDDSNGMPNLRINDVSTSEGNSGTKNLTFTVTINQTSTSAVRMNYITANGSATAGSDYTAAPSTPLEISAGARTATINISITGDTAVEPDETFTVTLSNVTGANLIDSAGVGTILNDDGVITSTPTATSTPQPTATPIPTMALCADMNGTVNPIIRAQVPPGTVTNGNVYCRVLAENGKFIYVGGSASVGNEQVLRLGVIHAVDVFGLLADGVSTRDFNNGVLVCLQGVGSLIYLDARGAPRPPVRLTNTTNEGGYTCGTIPNAGTVVLVGQPGDLPGIATGSGGGGSSGPAFALSDCVVTTMMRLNLRVWGGLDGRIVAIVPEGVALPAFERTRRWYRVQYGDVSGWISAFYVRPEGACGD